ncbi:alpha-(1,6)-fucosyltransferase [Plodia interpunctella]|uniref:alpha-(1,6)-fucosyltransferase n=1 Tax=Plodia interpunctella TaxID=58824 RepID=UPI00236860FC|nr:alpha-(1,6)-fucosyltransferase [Plodia interpunctella]XP_053608630.1 alpha-(1,6)-fucosyltransferase [Plodia interpunctella]XP_053608631.1 alpha-(1,6)-fucosyltransferase [Plodia interpunctella]XP_053608632.1 alpha-(1,6)-fucosyltransferase [Plodia interpunctella]
MKYHSNGSLTFGDYFMMYLPKWKRVAVCLLMIWIVVTYLVISPLRCNGTPDEVIELQDKLRRLSSQLESMKLKRSNLISQIKKSSSVNGNLKDIDLLLLEGGHGPSEEYEYLRRRIYSNTKELWYYVNHELTKFLKEENKESLQTILDEVSERKSSLLSDQEKLEELDGYHEWRQAEAANVSDLIQRRLYYLQNPPDCKEARKVICNLNKGCGFGCQLHHIVYCLIFAYATERTLILNSKGWRYNTRGWDYVFYPISESCTSSYNDKEQRWPVSQHHAKVISLPFIDSMMQKPKFLPQAVPMDLAHRIVRFNGDPASWWVGQIIKYVLKPRSKLQKSINDTITKMNFRKPIVGVHIRRTDKVGTEAAFHHIDEYMQHVRQYYDKLELTAKVDVRRVYLASDDANVLEDARKKYPDYVFLGDSSIAQSAATHRRYTPASLTGLLVDLNMLANCDYLVCTFSSQVGRLAYELMQTNRPDASNSFFSLDDVYYYGGQISNDRIAVLPNAGGSSDIALQVNDLIGVAGNHWNGYGRGTNRRTNVLGLFPWYKTAAHLVLYPFPEYKQVPMYTTSAPYN